MSTALYRKWRSQNFDEVVGQEHVTQTLRNALRDDRIAHAYLFSGPRGTGKTSVARILAKALNCTAPEEQRPCGVCSVCIAIAEGRMIDLIEIDAASNNSVEDVRELRDKVGFRPSEGRFKIYLVDEVHMLSTSAFNALLKTLEEPPPHARFILATTEPHKIPATIISRCQRFDFRRIPVPEIAGHLRHIVQAEGFKAEEEALIAIGRAAQGCMRDAVSLLDQMFSYGAATVTFAQVQQALGAVNAQAVVEFVNAVANKNITAGLALIQQLMTQGASLVEFSHQVVEHLRGVMVVQMTGDVSLLRDLPGETVRQMQNQAKQLSQVATLFAVKRFSEAVQELKGGFQPQLPLEMALIEVIQGSIVAPINMQIVAPAAQVATTAVPITTNHAVIPSLPTSSPASTPPIEATPPSATEPSAVSSTIESQAKPPAKVIVEPPPLDINAVKKLQTNWKEFQSKVKTELKDYNGHKAAAALSAVRDMAVGGSSVAFSFGENQFSHDVIAKPEMLIRVAATLSSYLGRKVTLECQMGFQAKLSGTVKAIKDDQNDGPDPLLDYAVSALGAKVIK